MGRTHAWGWVVRYAASRGTAASAVLRGGAKDLRWQWFDSVRLAVEGLEADGRLEAPKGVHVHQVALDPQHAQEPDEGQVPLHCSNEGSELGTLARALLSSAATWQGLKGLSSISGRRADPRVLPHSEADQQRREG